MGGHHAISISLAEDFMPKLVNIAFAPLSLPTSGSAVVFVDVEGKPSAKVAELLGEEALRAIARAAEIERFKGKGGSALTLLAPMGLALDKLIVVGTATEGEEFNPT